jgi:hypothetical protein
MAQVMEAKVTNPGRLERGVPMRIEMIIGRVELRLSGLRIENYRR